MARLRKDTRTTTVLSCSLEERALGERLEEIRRTLVPAMVEGPRPVGGGFAVVLGESAGLRERVERLMDLERECCQFLTLELESTAGGKLLLSATGPPAASGVLEELAEVLSEGRAGAQSL